MNPLDEGKAATNIYVMCRVIRVQIRTLTTLPFRHLATIGLVQPIVISSLDLTQSISTISERSVPFFD